MTTSIILTIVALLVLAAVSAYIYFGATRLHAQREARVQASATAKVTAPVAASPVAAPPPGFSPAPTVAPALGSPFLAAPDGPADDLTQIKGIGPKLSALLAELGVFHFRQIAAWTPDQLRDVDARLGNFTGRPERDQWQSQAQLLAAGDRKAYERVHGKLDAASASPSGPDSSAGTSQ